MKEEYIDILNDKGELTEQSQSKTDVHKGGLFHRTAHVWILDSDKRLLLQKRSSTKETYPNNWDISAAGHVSVGQTSLEAAQRETEEELSLSLSPNMFRYLFTVEEHVVLNGGTYINNEFQDVYLVQLDTVLPDIKLSDGEVSEIKWISVDEFKSWMGKKEYNLVPHDEEYNRLLEYIG